MAQDLEIFHFEEDRPSFETYARQNGFRHWLASELMVFLGYSSMTPIRNAINRAMATCAQLNISITENFEETKTETGARDWKLSRFACYLTVMNGDPKKHQVATAQAYFVTMAEAFRQFVQESERGIVNFAFFQNAGYRGMYNLDLAQIRRKKGVPNGRSALDFMGKTELAANLFRITQTEERIRNEDIFGQRPLEWAAELVGRTVRNTMIELSGTPPERLPPARDIIKVKGD